MSISILGIFVADLVFFGEKIPVEGETILGKNFVIGPGGKGSNQAVAAAKACLLYTSPSPRDLRKSRMPSSA